MASDALKQYAIFVDALIELRELFPFPHGGDPSKEENASIGVHLLNTEGVKCLETLHNFMKNYYGQLRRNNNYEGSADTELICKRS